MMAPTLFNIYASVIAEQWLSRVESVDDVGTLVVNKQDGLLFRWSTRTLMRLCCLRVS